MHALRVQIPQVLSALPDASPLLAWEPLGAESAGDVFRPRSPQEQRAARVSAEGTAPAIPSVFAQRVQWLFLDGFYLGVF